MDYKIIERQQFWVLEKVKTQTTEDDKNLKNIPDFWARSSENGTIDRLLSLALDKKYIFGICYGNKNSGEKTFDYSIAVICDRDTKVPDGYRKTNVSKKTWAVFKCVGPMPDAIQKMWKNIITEFFVTSPYKPTYEMDIEVYPDGDTQKDDYLSEIWIPVVKK